MKLRNTQDIAIKIISARIHIYNSTYVQLCQVEWVNLENLVQKEQNDIEFVLSVAKINVHTYLTI